MKIKPIVLSLGALTLIALTACNKQEAPPPAVSTEAAKTSSGADTISAAAQKTADAQKTAADALKAADAQAQADAAKADQALKQAAADKMAADQAAADKLAADKVAADQALAAKPAQLSGGTAQIQALIDSAKKLAGDNKWAEVLKIISDLAGQPLTPAQQTTVAGLKSEAQKQAQASLTQKAAGDASSALGGLLAPKK